MDFLYFEKNLMLSLLFKRVVDNSLGHLITINELDQLHLLQEFPDAIVLVSAEWEPSEFIKIKDKCEKMIIVGDGKDLSSVSINLPITYNDLLPSLKEKIKSL